MIIVPAANPMPTINRIGEPKIPVANFRSLADTWSRSSTFKPSARRRVATAFGSAVPITT